MEQWIPQTIITINWIQGYNRWEFHINCDSYPWWSILWNTSWTEQQYSWLHIVVEQDKSYQRNSNLNKNISLLEDKNSLVYIAGNIYSLQEPLHEFIIQQKLFQSDHFAVLQSNPTNNRYICYKKTGSFKSTSKHSDAMLAYSPPGSSKEHSSEASQ